MTGSQRLFDVTKMGILLGEAANRCVAGGLLVLLVPLFLWVLCVNARSGLLFRQHRVGLHGGRFTLLKFRSMSDARDETGRVLPDGQRLTRFGAFLRRTSLDELPQLWNVVCGHMNLVGPRPLLPEYVDRYTPEQARRHDVKPGITGWAQVNGRNAISWEEKFALDVWYVDNRSCWLDIKILALTVVRVFQRSGINAGANVTMPEFMGSERRS
jgi:sugar transferase EpsL